MSHPLRLPQPRLTKADLATLRYLIARTSDLSQRDELALPPAQTPANRPCLGWLDRQFPTH